MFRPEALETLKRWREPALIAVLFGFSLWFLWRAYVQSNLISGAIGLLFVSAVGGLLYIAFLRARLRHAVAGPGIVEVRERLVTYFSPDDRGGESDLETLMRLQLSTLPNDLGDRNWILWDSNGSLVIPVYAEGADELIEAFAALPGLTYDKIVRVMDSREQKIFTIWQRGK